MINGNQPPTLKDFLEEINNLIDCKIPIRTVLSVPISDKLFHFLPFTGIYILYSKDELIYIGFSSNIGVRLSSHFSASSRFKKIKKIEIIRLYNSDDVLEIEAQLIDYFNPPYNKTNAYLDYKKLPPDINLNNMIKQIEKNKQTNKD